MELLSVISLCRILSSSVKNSVLIRPTFVDFVDDLYEHLSADEQWLKTKMIASICLCHCHMHVHECTRDNATQTRISHAIR